MTIQEMNKSTREGRLLWAALIELTTSKYSNLTPDQVLGLLEDKAKITIDLLRVEDELYETKRLIGEILRAGAQYTGAAKIIFLEDQLQKVLAWKFEKTEEQKQTEYFDNIKKYRDLEQDVLKERFKTP